MTNSRQYFINPTDNSLAVILRGNNNGRVIFVPTGTGENLTKYTDKIVEAINELKKSATENLTAWIFGGNRITNGGEKGSNTASALNGVADAIERFKDIDLSILAGNKGEPLRLFVRTKYSKGPLNKDSNFKIVANLDLNPKSKEPLESQLKDRFDIVELTNVQLSDMSSF